MKYLKLIKNVDEEDNCTNYGEKPSVISCRIHKTITYNPLIEDENIITYSLIENSISYNPTELAWNTNLVTISYSLQKYVNDEPTEIVTLTKDISISPNEDEVIYNDSFVSSNGNITIPYYFIKPAKIIESIGYIDSNNSILVDSLPSGEYTLSYADENNNILNDWKYITKITK